MIMVMWSCTYSLPSKGITTGLKTFGQRGMSSYVCYESIIIFPQLLLLVIVFDLKIIKKRIPYVK